MPKTHCPKTCCTISVVNKKLFSSIFVAITILAFLFYKTSHLSFRFGDGNAYIYMAQQMTHGVLPYKDFFLADPPLLILVMSLFKLIIGENFLLFQLFPIMLEAGTALLLFLLLQKQKNKFAYLAPLLYLFSFTILTTSDYITGAQLVSFFVVMALLLWEKKKFIGVGICLALACLTKLYAVAPLLGFLCFMVIHKEYKKLQTVLLAFAITSIIILSPFFFIAPYQVIQNLIIHQFHRPAGIDKASVWQFFFLKEWLLLLFAIGGLFVARKHIIIFPALFTTVFFLFFPDIYFVYFAVFMPYVVLGVYFCLQYLWEKVSLGKEAVWLSIVFITISLIITFHDYTTNTFIKGRFLNATSIAVALKKASPTYPIYGSYEIAPLIATITNRKIFDNYIDTNIQVFASGALNKSSVSKQAIEQGILLLARITDRPDIGIRDSGYQGYFDKTIFQKYCKRIKTFPSTSDEADNHIVVYKCKK